jgi:hypothetical protein
LYTQQVPGPIPRSERQWHAYLRSRLRAGVGVDELRRELVATGMGTLQADRLLTESARTVRTLAARQIAVGAVVIAVTVVVAILTYRPARQGQLDLISFAPVILAAVALILIALYQLVRTPKP